MLYASVIVPSPVHCSVNRPNGKRVFAQCKQPELHAGAGMVAAAAGVSGAEAAGATSMTIPNAK